VRRHLPAIEGRRVAANTAIWHRKVRDNGRRYGRGASTGSRLDDRVPAGYKPAMNWLTNFVLPKIRAVVAKKAAPDNLWTKCLGCEQMLFYRELEANLHVCRNCGHHLRIGAELRLKIIFGDGAFARIELPKAIVDPLKFRDRRRYAERLREGQAALGAGSDAVVVAHGEIGGHPAVVAAFEFQFMGGSMGMHQA